MKKIGLLIFSLLMILPCSCHIREVEDPAVSSPPSFDDTHTVSNDKSIVWAEIVIQNVYPNVCKNKYDEQTYLLAICQIRNLFFISDNCPDYDSLCKNGNSILLWINIDDIQEKYYPKLYQIMNQAESLIIYANNKPAIIGYNGLDEKVTQALTNYGLNCYITNSCLVEPPSLYVTTLYCWDLIPIIDGVVDGSDFQRIINNSHSAEMIYDIDAKNDSMITAGDTIEDVYAFLEEYVERSNK